MEMTYKIKNSLKIPMAISILLSLPIVIDMLSTGFPRSHIITVSILFVIFYLLAINSLIRRVMLTEEGVSIRGLLGTKTMLLSEISTLDGVSFGTKQYLTISGNNKNFIIPNSFSGFNEIVGFFCAHLKEKTLGDGAMQIQENPLVRRSDVIAAWITALILAVIVLVRVSSFQ